MAESFEPESKDRVLSAVRPRVYGWMLAEQLEALGQVQTGDFKHDADRVWWVWDGNRWVKIERNYSTATKDEA